MTPYRHGFCADHLKAHPTYINPMHYDGSITPPYLNYGEANGEFAQHVNLKCRI